MKVCPKCGAEYQDQDSYCAKCGAKLDATNVCQKCGRPVTNDEVFCRHCGHQIEKEYKCEQCGAVLNENAKFCPECGAKNENPVVSIKKRTAPVKKANNASTSNVANKIMFWSLGGTILFLFLLMFIGCFGDILRVNVRGLASQGAGSSLLEGEYSRSIKYFFGDGLKQIEKDSYNLQDAGYKVFAIMMLIFEMLAWIGAYIAIAIAAIFVAINVASGAKKEYKLSTKPFFISSAFVINYLALIALENITYMSVYDRSGSYARTYNVDLTFGWGTTMMLVSVILGVASIVAVKVLTAIFSKEDIVKRSVFSGIALVLTIALLTSLGQVAGIDYKSNGSGFTGTSSVYSCYTNNLYQYCTDAIEEIPGYAFQCLYGSLIVLVGYIFTFVLVKLLLDKKQSKPAVIVLSAVSFFCLLLGHILTAVGANESMKDSNYYNFTYSAPGVILPLFVIGAMVAFIIFSSLKPKAQPAQQA